MIGRAALLAALMLGASAGSAAIQASVEQAAEAMRAGEAAYQAGDLRGAIRHFERASQADETGMARLAMGAIREELGDEEAAAEDFWFVVENGGGEPRKTAFARLSNRANQLYLAGDDAAAEAIYGRLLEHNGLHRDVLHNYSLSLYRQKKWPALEASAARLVKLDPLNANAWVILYNARKGLYEKVAGDPAQAEAAAAWRNGALAALATADGLPVQLTKPEVTVGDGGAVAATIGGGAAPAGSRCTITFHFMAWGEEVATASVPVVAPARGETVTVKAEASADERVESVRYTYPPCEGWARADDQKGER